MSYPISPEAAGHTAGAASGGSPRPGRNPAAWRAPVLATLGIIAATLVAAAVVATHGPQRWPLADPDAYLRMIRVLELHDGGPWYGEVTHRIGAPEGLSIHWTRPLDVLILLPGLLVQAITGASARDALLAMGIVISPALFLGCLAATAWAARGLWRGAGAVSAPVFLALNPVTLAYAAPGRSDHHILLLLCVILGLGAAIRALLPEGRMPMAVSAGIAFGCGIWVTPEALIVVLPILAAVGLAWVFASDGSHAARQGLAISLGLGLAVLTAVALERPPAGWLDVTFDRVSVHHLAIAATSAAVFLEATRHGKARPVHRLVRGALVAGVAATGLLAVFPDMVSGSLASADQDVRRLMLPLMSEMAPLWPIGDGGPARLVMAWGGAPLAAIAATVLAFPAWMRDEGWPAGLAAVGAFLATAAVSIGAIRLVLDLSAPAAILAGGLFARIAPDDSPRHRQLRLVLAVLATTALLATPAWASLMRRPGGGTQAPPASCNLESLVGWLDRSRPGVTAGAPAPVMITGRFDLGPEISWRTPYRTVAGPYHRNARSIFDTVAVFDAPDLDAARGILARRGVTLLLFCVHDPAPVSTAGTLRGTLLTGAAPAWLEAVRIPDGLQEFRLFAVRP